MSDVEEKKSGYRLEYAKNNRAKCKGPKPCNGTVLDKGTLKIGSVVDFRGHTSFAWRHWGCTTPTIIDNMKKSFSEADELDGFDELQPADQDKIRKAWEDGHVADEDVPETARKAEGDDGADEAKPKKKRAPAKKAEEGEAAKPKKARASKKKSEEEGEALDDDDVEKEKPKKAPVAKSRPKKAKDEDQEMNGAEEDEEPKPKKKAVPLKRASAAEKKVTEKKASKKRAAKKEVEEESGEDFADEIDNAPVDDDDDELSEVENKKRKRPVSKTSTKPASKKAAKPASGRAKKTKVTHGYEEED